MPGFTSAGALSILGNGNYKETFNGKHPYHLIAVKGGGSTVYGWVDAADIAVEASAAIAKGSTVKVKAGAKTYTGGGLAVVWYMVVAAVVVGFMVAYAAMFGFDKLKEAIAQIEKKKD